jgi:sulfite reductase (ferredoxin)
MFKLPRKVIDDGKKYKESFIKFSAGELKEAFFKGIRVPWGNYAQRGGQMLMSRLRLPAGIMTPGQLKAIGEAAQKFADGKLHLTTRQDIQIHNVPKEKPVAILEYLAGYDVSPRGGGGNTVRGITACYLSGICPHEKNEVYKLNWGLTEYFLSLDDSFNLPRKLKFALSGCGDDCASVGVNDLGFVAVGDGLKVLCGGGMGAKCAVGKVLHEKIDASEAGYVAKAVMNVFNKHGNRKNRHRNRLRFLIEDLGWEKFVELYREELKRVKDEEHIVLRVDELPALKPLTPYSPSPLLRGKGIGDGGDYADFTKFSLGEQKQAGYYYIKLRVPFGEITADQLIRLAELGEEIPGVIFRATPRQNLIMTNVPFDKVSFAHDELKTILPDFLFAETILDVVSCKAATTCNLGICNAIALAPVVVEKLKSANLDLEKLKDVRIHLNGCSNSCGHHPLGTLSFSGAAKKVYNRTVPFYKVWTGGKANAENTKLAVEVGMVPARSVPDLVGEYFSSGQKTPLLELVKKYAHVPAYEDDRSYYVDSGRTEDFSMDGLGQGECGAGAIDMIESDLNSAKQSLAKTNIKEALVYAARALLVVRGVDPKDEKEAIAAFADKFIKGGICAPDFSDLEAIYKDVVAGSIAKDQAYDWAQKFYEEVKNIYGLMDSSFNFLVRFEGKDKEKEKEKVAAEVYDLRGTPCPINYVKAKIRLEGMNVGDVLEILLDDGEPIRNVPKSLENDGQDVKVEPIENYFKLVVRKKV